MPCNWYTVPVLTFNKLFVSPAPAQEVPPPAQLTAVADSEPASALAESTDTAAPAAAKTKRSFTAQTRRITPNNPCNPFRCTAPC